MKTKELENCESLIEDKNDLEEEEKQITEKIYKEREYIKKKYADFEQNQQDIEIKIKKKMQEQEKRMEKKLNFQAGVSDMIPIIKRDIQETRERIKKMRKDHKEEVVYYQSQLIKYNAEMYKKETELREMELRYRLELLSIKEKQGK